MSHTVYANGSNTLTVGTETVLSAPNVPGRYKLVCNMSNVTTSDMVEARAYAIPRSGDSSILLAGGVYLNDTPAWESEWFDTAIYDTNALQFSLKQITGTGRTITWSVLREEPDDVYQAKIWLDVDDAGTADRYMVAWFKNGTLVNSGITGALIQIIKASDASNLLAATLMSQIGSYGQYKYDASGSARITKGALYLIVMSATIDGSLRTWVQPMSRDN